jgi:hypothetical protein
MASLAYLSLSFQRLFPVSHPLFGELKIRIMHMARMMTHLASGRVDPGRREEGVMAESCALCAAKAEVGSSKGSYIHPDLYGSSNCWGGRVEH